MKYSVINEYIIAQRIDFLEKSKIIQCIYRCSIETNYHKENYYKNANFLIFLFVKRIFIKRFVKN